MQRVRVGILAVATVVACTACEGLITDPGGTAETGPGPDTPPTTVLPGGDDFACDDASRGSVSPSYVLSKDQLRNTIEDLFGSSALGAAEIGMSRLGAETFDAVSHARTSTLETSKVNAYYDIARAVAEHVLADDALTEQVFGACALEATPPVSCIDEFIDGYAAQILRRPLNPSEAAFLGMLSERPGTFRENGEAALAYLMQSPHFIWRIELGADVTEEDRFALTQHEVATRIAFAVTDSTPDAELLAAADGGALSSPDEIEAQVRRLLWTDRGRTKVVDNLAHWSMSDRTADLSTLPAALIEGVETDGLAQAMLDEVRVFIDAIVFEEQGSLGDLLASTDSFADHPGLAAIYEHEPTDGASPAAMGGDRRGLLMRAPGLTWTGPRTSIIHRGVDFQLRVLCNQIPAPSVAIAEARENNALPEEEAAVSSNRHVIAHMTSPDTCMTCHSVINPTGFAFERFDPLGRFRTEEMLFDLEGNMIGTAPIDAMSAIPLPDGSELPVSGAGELVDYVSTSSQGRACLARNLFRFVTERVETGSDDCRLQAVHTTLMSPDTTLVDALSVLIAHESVLEKVVSE